MTDPPASLVVLRLAAITRSRDNRAPELARLFPAGVQAETVIGLRVAAEVVVERLGAVAALAC